MGVYFRPPRLLRLWLLLPPVLFVLLGQAAAQFQVEIDIPRSMFIRYEPVLVLVSIRNLSGRSIHLADDGGTPWFNFQIQMQDGRPIQPRGGQVTMSPVTIGPGEMLRRQVNLTPLFALDDFGRYRVSAAVFDASTGSFFSSRQVTIEMTDGRLVWQKTVGHPGEGGQRQISLLAHRLTASTALYLRIQDPDAGRVYCTHRLGPLLTYGPPQVELDRNNEVHVLHLNAPRSHIYSHIGLNGEVIERVAYRETRTKPVLRRDEQGVVAVVGGVVFDPGQDQPDAQMPAIGDRPVPLPGSEPGGAPPRAVPGSEPDVPAAERPPARPGFNIWPFRRQSE